jgi:glycosyltransferase involved in cell wall biosynthesis
MPCLNEAETLATCVRKALAFLSQHRLLGEVLVADNGSTDGSPDIAASEGARVVPVELRGYGAALMGGINAAGGKYVIMGDADDSYDFSELMPFIVRLREGADLVMGNRFKGGIEPRAMPFSHQYLGNPVLSWLGRLFFGIRVRDFYCGLRGFNRNKILGLNLRTTGMEFAPEMVIRAAFGGLRIEEVPTNLRRDGRSRPPHLRTWRDGWRGLSFLLVYSPRWLFLYPGLVLLVTGIISAIILLPGPIFIEGVGFDIHTFIVACFLVLLGAQAVGFSLLARRIAVSHKLIPPSSRYSAIIDALTLERVLIGAALLILGGLGGFLYAVGKWVSVGLGPLQYEELLRGLILSMTIMAIGLQAAFIAFASAIMEVPMR